MNEELFGHDNAGAEHVEFSVQDLTCKEHDDYRLSNLSRRKRRDSLPHQSNLSIEVNESEGCVDTFSARSL